LPAILQFEATFADIIPTKGPEDIEEGRNWTSAHEPALTTKSGWRASNWMWA